MNLIVILTKQAEKDLCKIPLYLADKFQMWVDILENDGLQEARKIKSFHDEPLQGKRFGQRSIRLNQAYRAIYRDLRNGSIEIIEVLEINKHDY